VKGNILRESDFSSFGHSFSRLRKSRMYIERGKGSIAGAVRASTRKVLAGMRLRAIRRGVWFKELSREERVLVDLVIKVTDKVRSFLLAKLLSQIVEKLLDALEGEVTRLMRTVGRPLARKLSGVAQGWGNRSASKWPQDSGFVQYLTIMHLNKP